GIAYCEAPNYNDPMPDENRCRAGWYAIQNALARLDGASRVEQALIQALRKRFSSSPVEDRTRLNKAYADAMAGVWEQYPEDADVGAIYAESMMQLRPWQLYSKNREPKDGTLKIREVLEKVMKLDPRHAGAKHLYIHAVEPSSRPEDALPAARGLNDLVPASGHLLHMPSHIYIQTGHWQEAIDQNVKAVQSDTRYRQLSPEQLIQYGYQAHNAHMLAFAAMMVGQEKTAMKYARKIWAIIPPDQMEQKGPSIDFTFMCVYDVQKRFGRWDQILAEPQPPEFLPLTTAYYHAHRAVAFAAKKQIFEAEKEFSLFLKVKSGFPEDKPAAGAINHQVLKVAEQFVLGEIALHQKDWDAAIHHLKRSAKVEDSLRYAEPPFWLQPVRHALGAVYMKAGRYREAEQTYRKDLEIWKDNGWSLYGLSQSLKNLEKGKEAEEVLQKFKTIWKNADESILTTSCKCIENLKKPMAKERENGKPR
ncbi:MAG: tetratricopeptide repeat protein, partial [Planctomycetota bacterium]|nr:tetratricopeptide repeat protein [Planctomycetota bacterium]